MANVAPQLDPISAASIDYQRQLAEALRQQQYGQLMQGQGLQKIDYDPKGAVHWSQGLAKMLQSYLGAKDLRQSDETMAELKARAGQNQMKMFGMGEDQPQPMPQQEAPQQQEMPQQTMQYGYVTPDQQNARVNGYQSPNQPQPMPQPAPQQLAQAVKNYPMRLSGDPGKDYMMYIQNPEAFSKAMIEQNTPIAEVKRARDLGINLNQFTEAEKRKLSRSDLFDWEKSGLTAPEARQAALAAAAKAGDITRAPGQMFTNQFTGQTGIVPSLPQYSQASKVLPNGNVQSVSAIPGAIPVAAQVAGATEGARVGEQIGEATNEVGQTVKGRNRDVFGGNNQGYPAGTRVPAPADSGKISQGQSDRVSLLQQELNTEKNPQNRAALEREIKRVGGVVTGPVAGATDQQKALFSRNDQVKQDVVPNKQDIDALDKIGTLATQGLFGPGTSTSARWKAIAANLPGYGFVPIVPGVDETKADATNQAILKKLMSQMASRVSTGGTDARLQSALDQLPNSEMTNEAILHVVPMLKAQKAAAVADAQLRSKIDPTDVKAINAHENQWREAYDPRVFELQTMPPAQQMQYIKSLSPADAAKLRDKRQKLMKMGAFGG